MYMGSGPTPAWPAGQPRQRRRHTLDPTTRCCPKPPGPARGQTGRGHRGSPSPQDHRGIGHGWHQPCRATQGPVWSRRRPSAATVVLGGPWLAPGGPGPALVAAVECAARTGAAWGARAGRPGQAVPADLVEPPRDWGQGPAEASRVTTPGRLWAGPGVKPRVWRGGEVRAPRDRPRLRRLRARGRRGAAPRPLGVCPEGGAAAIRALWETWREPGQTGTGGRPRRRPWPHVVIAHGVQRDARRRVVETEGRRVAGPPARVATRRGRSPGGGGITTASLARLHAPCRERLAPGARRCRALARHPRTWPAGMVVVGTVETVCTPPARWSPTPQTTPAMAAGLTDPGWTRPARLSCHGPRSRWAPPQPRGPPSPALKRRIEPWCGDHG